MIIIIIIIIIVESEKAFKIGRLLSEGQRSEMLAMLEELPDVFSDLPGKCNLVKCEIKLKDDSPCRKVAYRIPFALQSEVESQITQMLSMGLIRESDSDYSSPLVIVRK